MSKIIEEYDGNNVNQLATRYGIQRKNDTENLAFCPLFYETTLLSDFNGVVSYCCILISTAAAAVIAVVVIIIAGIVIADISALRAVII